MGVNEQREVHQKEEEVRKKQEGEGVVVEEVYKEHEQEEEEDEKEEEEEEEEEEKKEEENGVVMEEVQQEGEVHKEEDEVVVVVEEEKTVTLTQSTYQTLLNRVAVVEARKGDDDTVLSKVLSSIIQLNETVADIRTRLVCYLCLVPFFSQCDVSKWLTLIIVRHVLND
jgi:hypothetical protein